MKTHFLFWFLRFKFWFFFCWSLHSLVFFLSLSHWAEKHVYIYLFFNHSYSFLFLFSINSIFTFSLNHFILSFYGRCVQFIHWNKILCIYKIMLLMFMSVQMFELLKWIKFKLFVLNTYREVWPCIMVYSHIIIITTIIDWFILSLGRLPSLCS